MTDDGNLDPVRFTWPRAFAIIIGSLAAFGALVAVRATEWIGDWMWLWLPVGLLSLARLRRRRQPR